MLGLKPGQGPVALFVTLFTVGFTIWYLIQGNTELFGQDQLIVIGEGHDGYHAGANESLTIFPTVLFRQAEKSTLAQSCGFHRP